MYTIFGHTNPDTDAICSAIIMQGYLKQQDIEAKAYRLGELNTETKFVLEKAGIIEPELLSVLHGDEKIILTDHNATSQSHPQLDYEQVEWIVDHHMSESIVTSKPINLRFEAICSTCSILYKMYREKGMDISDSIATLMLAGILSDSLAFRSPTTTDEDQAIVEILADQLKIEDIQSYAKEMFDAKSDLGDISARNLVTLDYKEFDMSGTKIGYGVIETTNPGYSLGRKEELLTEMKKLKNETSLDFILLSVVDILEEENTTLVIGEDETKVLKEVFEVETEKNIANLGNRISRKKQIAPDLKIYFEK